VFKAFTTRVGAGPLANEITVEEAKKRGWIEYGTVTGRPRRAAPFNTELAKRAVMLNGATQAALTKLDVLYPECKGGKSFSRLSKEGKAFVEDIEAQIGIPVTLIGTGPDALEMVDRRK
jgi:adenylosuccinate synthase